MAIIQIRLFSTLREKKPAVRKFSPPSALAAASRQRGGTKKTPNSEKKTLLFCKLKNVIYTFSFKSSL